MTILGDPGDLLPGMMKILMKQDLRLLFVSKNVDQNSNLKTGLEQTEAAAEIEFSSCQRNGCWEADIIVITQTEKASSTLLNRIKEVATQKIVLAIWGDLKELEDINLQQFLPYSRIVELHKDSRNRVFSFVGEDPEANESVKEIFEHARFHYADRYS